MKPELIVGIQIALILLWAAVNIGREALRLRRARTELALWRGKAAMLTSEPDSGQGIEPAYEPSVPAVTPPASGNGHRAKGRGKKAKRRGR